MTVIETTQWPRELVTLADWERMPVDELHHVECTEGVLIVSPKPYLRHQHAERVLANALDDQLPGDLIAFQEVDVLLTEAPLTMRAPDIVVGPESALTANQPRLKASEVLLVVEILSAGSRRADQITKLSEYAEAGITDYWIVDLDEPVTISCFRLDGDIYRLDSEHHSSAHVPVCGTTVHLEPAALVRR